MSKNDMLDLYLTNEDAEITSTNMLKTTIKMLAIVLWTQLYKL